MQPAVYEKKNGTLRIRFKRQALVPGLLLIVAGGMLLPSGISMLLTEEWSKQLSWMMIGMGALVEAGGLVLILRERLLPAAFHVDRSHFRILERNGSSVTLPLSLFDECGIRSTDGRRRGPFYIYMRGPSGLDFDISRYRLQKKAAADLQLLCSITGLSPLEAPASPEERTRFAFSLPELRSDLHMDGVGDLRTLRRRLKEEGRLQLSVNRRTLCFRDPSARRHSLISLLFLVFLLSVAMTVYYQGAPAIVSTLVYGLILFVALWMLYYTFRSVFFDEGLSVGPGFIRRRFSVFRSKLPEIVPPTGSRQCIPVLTFLGQIGVPAVGYFDEAYRKEVQNITLNPVQLMRLAMKRSFALSHRLYGFRLSESVALYSVVREVIAHGRNLSGL